MPEPSGQDPTTELPAGETPPTTSTTRDPDDPSWDRDRAMRTINTLREHEKAGQKAAEERDRALARVRELEDAQKSDAERKDDEMARLRAQVAESEARQKEHDAQARRWRLERAVIEAAPKAGIADVALALKVIDIDDITFDDDGKPGNVDDVLAGIVERHPALAGETPRPKPTTTDARKGRTQPDGPKLTAEEMDIARRMGMSPDEYARFKGVHAADDYAALTSAANHKE